jgi:hypothetical protein
MQPSRTWSELNWRTALRGDVRGTKRIAPRQEKKEEKMFVTALAGSVRLVAASRPRMLLGFGASGTCN